MGSVSAFVNLPLHHKVQTFSSGTGSPGWSRKKGRKMAVELWWLKQNAECENRLTGFHKQNKWKNYSVYPFFIWLQNELEMWASAQRDGHRAEYRWHPLFNAAKFGWRPLLKCHAVTLPRCETRWNLQGCPKLANRSQPLVGRSLPYFEGMWRRYWRLTSFFRLSIHALAAKIHPDKVVRCCQNGDIFASCISSEPLAAHFRPVF